MCESTVEIHGKTVIVTGANTGVGKETVRDLVSRGLYICVLSPFVLFKVIQQAM